MKLKQTREREDQQPLCHTYHHTTPAATTPLTPQTLIVTACKHKSLIFFLKSSKIITYRKTRSILVKLRHERRSNTPKEALTRIK